MDPCVFNPVQFTTNSAGPLWHWNFGDGSAPNLTINPTHPYNLSGNFQIQLYVTNAQGCSDTAYAMIHVDTIPYIPVITGPQNVCVNSPATYTFSQPLYTGALYDWSLSAPALGTITSTTTNSFAINWTTPGTDTVRLHVKSTCLDTILRYVVNVHPYPTPGISVSSPACQLSNVTFTGSGGTAYQWSFSGGNPQTPTNIQSPVVNYPNAGTYGVSLTVTNAFGCTTATNSTISILPLPLAVNTVTGKLVVRMHP